jgi:hypothetical protein
LCAKMFRCRTVEAVLIIALVFRFAIAMFGLIYVWEK